MLLEDDSYKVRVQAAQLLGKLGDPAGVGPLARALADSNKTVRWMAVQALARLANPAAVPALKALLARETGRFGARPRRRRPWPRWATRRGPGKKPGRIFLTFGSFSGGARGADATALEVLRRRLRRELGKLPSVTFEGGDAKNFWQRRRSWAFSSTATSAGWTMAW